MKKTSNIIIRLIFYVCVISAILIVGYYRGAPAQKRNMKQAETEIQSFKSVLNTHIEFSNIKILTSTANLGKNIGFMGSVPDSESLDDFISLAKDHFSPKFNLTYNIDINTASRAIPER